MLLSVAVRDARVRFQERPRGYYVDGVRMGKSVTELVHRYFKPFNARPIARGMLVRPNFLTLEKYREYWPLKDHDLEASISRVVAAWEETSRLGTQMHQTIEDWYNTGKPLPDCKESVLFTEFHQYAVHLGCTPLKSEQILWSNKYNLAGCCDMIYIVPPVQCVHMIPPGDTRTPVWLVDWKRSKEIKQEGFDTGTGLCDHKPDCNFQHYSLQLNIYKYLLERSYGVIVVRMTMVILHPSQQHHLRFEVSSDQALVRKVLRQ